MMKRCLILLLCCLWAGGMAIASAAGTITGIVYLPNSERGMHITKGESGAGMMWDMTAPKNRKSSERAEIWLIERSINFTALPYSTVQKWYQDKTIPAGQPIYRTTADEQGNFAFQDVPASDYYLVILDPFGQESSQTLSEKLNRDELLKRLPHADEFELFMVGTRTCLVEKITLRNGQTINIRPGIF